jgi:ribonuclease HI
VDFLIDDHSAWNTDMVNSIFEEGVATQILQVPISRYGGFDFASWPHNKFGVYTVRSAYNLARVCEFNQARSVSRRGLQSDLGEETKSWKKLWAISALGKMKITLWRFAHDCLPSGRPMIVYTVNGMRTLGMGRSNFLSKKKWLFDFLSRSTDQQLTVLAVTFWHLWETRNGFCNGETMKHPHSLAEQIKVYVVMIDLYLRKPFSSHRCESNSSLVKWTPPPTGTVLLNVDGAMFKSSNRMGVGVMIQNHRGDCLAACSELISEVTSPQLAKALAIRRALSFTREEGFEKIMIASDCLSVVQRINNTAQDRSFLGAVIQDIKMEATLFTSCSFLHVSVSSVNQHMS